MIGIVLTTTQPTEEILRAIESVIESRKSLYSCFFVAISNSDAAQIWSSISLRVIVLGCFQRPSAAFRHLAERLLLKSFNTLAAQASPCIAENSCEGFSSVNTIRS